MNLAETALADFTVTNQASGTTHGPWPCWDWENIRFSAKENGGVAISFAITWYMTIDDTLTVSDTIALPASGTVDQILETKGAFVSVTGTGGSPLSYRARLWPGEFDFGDNSTMDNLWKDSAGTLEPITNPATFSVVTNGGVSGANPGDAELVSSGGIIRIQSDTEIDIIQTGNGPISIDNSGVGQPINLLAAILALTAGGHNIDARDNTGNLQLTITGLPILNPGGSGIVWNNGGVLNIT